MADNTYPLLHAWQSGQLRPVWLQERDLMLKEDPKLLDWVADFGAAACVSARITAEYETLRGEAKRRALRCGYEPDYTDEIIEFYDTLQDDHLVHYRSVLQDISGNPQIWLDELRVEQSLGL